MFYLFTISEKLKLSDKIYERFCCLQVNKVNFAENNAVIQLTVTFDYVIPEGKRDKKKA